MPPAATTDPRDWLRAAAEQIRTLAYRTACDMIRVGGLLDEARGRFEKRRSFNAWVSAEFPWSRSHSYRLIAVARTFGPLVDPARAERIEPTALYLLARAEVPPAAREYAVELSADRPVTAADARAILESHRPTPDPDPKETRALAPLRPADRATDPDPPAPPPAWAALERLAAASTVIHIGNISEEGGEDEPLYTITVYSHDDGPRNWVRRNLTDAILSAAGCEPTKQCPQCRHEGRGPKPVGEFGADAGQPDGRNRSCKACQRARLSAFKRRKKLALRAS